MRTRDPARGPSIDGTPGVLATGVRPPGATAGPGGVRPTTPGPPEDEMARRTMTLVELTAGGGAGPDRTVALVVRGRVPPLPAGVEDAPGPGYGRRTLRVTAGDAEALGALAALLRVPPDVGFTADAADLLPVLRGEAPPPDASDGPPEAHGTVPATLDGPEVPHGSPDAADGPREGSGGDDPDGPGARRPVRGFEVGRVLVAERRHRGPWGTCGYRVRCDEDGGYTLVGLTGARTDLAVGDRWATSHEMFVALTGRARPRTVIGRFFRT